MDNLPNVSACLSFNSGHIRPVKWWVGLVLSCVNPDHVHSDFKILESFCVSSISGSS